MGTLFGKEGGIQVLAGLVQSIQKVGSLLKTPWLAYPARKFWQKSYAANSLQLKNALGYF
jgi:hypothetical protein